MRALAPRVVALCACAALSGCLTLRGPEPDQRELRGGDPRVSDWIERARSEAEARRSIRAYARVRIQSDAGAGRFREVIAAERPDRLRVETLNFLGQTQSLLVADGARATLFDGQRASDGKPAELLLELGLDLAPDDAIELLLASPALSRESPQRVLAEGAERVAEFSDQRLRFAEDGALLGATQLDADGALRWSVDFARWSDVSGGRFPLEIRVYFPRTQLRAEFQLEDVELNASLEAQLFRAPPRP
jgi:outer membrane lipoprotein-sorting protein